MTLFHSFTSIRNRGTQPRPEQIDLELGLPNIVYGPGYTEQMYNYHLRMKTNVQNEQSPVAPATLSSEIQVPNYNVVSLGTTTSHDSHIVIVNPF